MRKGGVRSWMVAALVVIGGLAGGAVDARAADGALDPSFGSGGIAQYDVGFGDYFPLAFASAEAVQSNGDVVLAGYTGDSGGSFDLMVARLTPGGARDATFGDDGVVDLNLPDTTGNQERDSYASAVTVGPDGDIAVGGHAPDGDIGAGYGIVIRLLPDGRLDPSFGSGGETLLQQTDVNGLAFTPTGNIVVTGATVDEVYATSPVVAELTPSGSLNQAFGQGGVVTEPSGGRLLKASLGEQVAVRPDGTIDVLGNGLDDGAGNATGFLAQFTANGTLDQSFGSAGFASLDLPGLIDPDAQDLVLTDTGFLTTASEPDPENGNDSRVVVERMLASGRPDPSFGTGGSTFRDGGLHYQIDVQGDPLTVRSDGSLLVSGSPPADGNASSHVWALTADGAPDDVFDGTDEETLPGDLATALIQPDGKVIFAGGADQPDRDTDLEAVRLLGPDTTAPATGGGGAAAPSQPAGSPAASPATGGAGAAAPSQPDGSPTASPSPGAGPSSVTGARTAMSLPGIVSCHAASGASRRTRALCTVRIQHASAGRLTGRLARGKHTIAHFTVRIAHPRPALTVTLHHSLTPGRYRLTATLSHPGGRLTLRRQVRVRADH